MENSYNSIMIQWAVHGVISRRLLLPRVRFLARFNRNFMFWASKWQTGIKETYCDRHVRFFARASCDLFYWPGLVVEHDSQWLIVLSPDTTLGNSYNVLLVANDYYSLGAFGPQFATQSGSQIWLIRDCVSHGNLFSHIKLDSVNHDGKLLGL